MVENNIAINMYILFYDLTISFEIYTYLSSIKGYYDEKWKIPSP